MTKTEFHFNIHKWMADLNMDIDCLSSLFDVSKATAKNWTLGRSAPASAKRRKMVINHLSELEPAPALKLELDEHIDKKIEKYLKHIKMKK